MKQVMNRLQVSLLIDCLGGFEILNAGIGDRRCDEREQSWADDECERVSHDALRNC